LLYGSARNLVTVVREPASGAGAVVVDTAFTRLYCQWDDAGSARYVCNAGMQLFLFWCVGVEVDSKGFLIRTIGCYLAAMTLAAQTPEEAAAAAAAAIAEPEVLEFDPTNAYRGTCDLTLETNAPWFVLSVAELADALRNTTDFAMNDPLATGVGNCIFSGQVYSEDMGRWIKQQSKDPFTQRTVVESMFCSVSLCMTG
jgi:hypothetical protein